jgi:lipopolysaccharide/colanic/teichoic acid biosynthesis glycosyltransferase
MYTFYIKRMLDIIIVIILFVVLFPVFLLLSILVLVFLGRPLFYIQKRPGFKAEPFQMVKFRTMTNEKNKSGNLLPNEERMTRFGMFLRSTSLDELPELFNVLKGDMSLVGPRPLLMDYLPYFSPEQNRRHDVKPGITGWAQVNGRNAIDWDEKLSLDIWYVENQTFLLDLKILFKTLFKVLRREDISYEGHVAMPRFDEFVNEKQSQL